MDRPVCVCSYHVTTVISYIFNELIWPETWEVEGLGYPNKSGSSKKLDIL